MPTADELLHGVPPAAAYGLVLGLVLLESVLLLGSFVPTLSLMLCAGVLAQEGTLRLPLVVLCATTGVVAGDLLAQRTGRRLGPGLRRSRLGRRLPEAAWERAWSVLQRRGGPALLVCRFVPVVRTFAPHLAGAAGMPYRRLAPYSLVAGLVWAGGEAGAGYVLGASYDRLTAPGGGLPTVCAAAGVLLAAAAGLLVHRRRARRAVGGSGRAGQRQADVGAQDRDVQMTQLAPGVHPELVAEDAADLRVRGQGLAPAAAAVEGEHQPLPQALAQRVLRGQRPQVADDLVVAAEGEAGVVVALDGPDPLLHQPRHHVPVERVRAHAAERLAVPEGQCLGEGGVLQCAVAELGGEPGAGGGFTEKSEIQTAGGDLDQVTAGRGVQQSGEPRAGCVQALS
uniref:Cinorf11 protein n=1 Tax=Streptomyces cinnamoneus TaxID=53446 RepID=Q83VX6_STRCJ|nr:Cinorf11 protein [Streptomyces cinnamoneus]